MRRLASPALPVAIHCWRVDLDDSGLDRRAVVLSDDEQARAARFVRPRDAIRYRRAHFALRLLLGLACGVSPAALKFDVNGFGKPRLPPVAGQRSRYFNLSHSEGQALIAISDRYELGVDIEVLRPIDDLDLLARSQLNPREFDDWCRLAPAARNRAFLACWTRKEAAVKAIGAGLSIEAAEVDVGPVEVDTGVAVRFTRLIPGFDTAREAGPGETDPTTVCPRLSDLTVLSLPADDTCVMAVAYGLPARD